MKRILDFSIVDWILKDLDQTGIGKVSNLLPNKFHKYFKILMPICIDKSIPIEEYSFKVNTIEDINRRSSFWDNYGIVNRHPSKEKLERITYKEISFQLNIPYDNFIDTQRIWDINKAWPPNLGRLIQEDLNTIDIITSIIGANTTTYFYGDVLDGKGLQENNEVVDWLRLGQLSEVRDIYLERNQDFPSYFFAANKDWCFCHPEDAGFLLLGCGEKVANDILESELLECFEFNSQESIK